MSSKIKVDTIENVAGSGNVSLGAGHNLVVPGDLTVDTNNLFVDASAEKVFVNRTTQTKNTDAFVVSSPAGGVGGGINNRVDMTVTAEDLTGDGGNNANAFVGTKAKGTYYSGLEMSSTSGHVGGWIGNYGASASTRALEARVGGTGINASDVGAMKITVDGHVQNPVQPSFMANGANGNYVSTSPIPFPTVSGSGVNTGTHNIGNHYNTSNYTFTAPIAGRYIFHVHLGIIRSENASSQAYPTLLVNGTGVAYTYVKFEVAPTANHYSHTHITQILNLAANDAVKVNFSQASGGTYYNGASESSFQGYFLG